MATLNVRLIDGQEFEVQEIDLERQTPKQLITELITGGQLKPESELPTTADGRNSIYGIVDKNNTKVDPDTNQTFSELGFVDGDTVRIITMAPGA